MNIPANDENLIGILEKLGKRNFSLIYCLSKSQRLWPCICHLLKRNWVASVFEKRSAFGW